VNVLARPKISLTTRLTAFFVGALALVLAGFSVTLYFVARSALSRQVDDRLASALHTLTAAVERHPSGLEWEPFNRMVPLGIEPDADEVRWTIRDGSGAVLEHSRNLTSDGFLSGISAPIAEGPRIVPRVKEGGRPWRVVQRRLDAGLRGRKRSPELHESLILTAALRLDPAESALRNLGRLTAGLSVAVWVVFAALGRRLCRRALRPLSTMAEAARGMRAAELDQQQLPSPGTTDELQELSDAFNGLLDRLREAFARQSTFTGDASHQLRTPLAAMIGQVDVALRRDRPAEDYKRTLALVRENAAHLSEIVEMLLFLARADAESALPGLRAIDLAAWAREHISTWSEGRRARDISLAVEGDGPWQVRAHGPLLTQLVDNLLDNACNHTDAGTTVRVIVASEGDSVVLAVEDDGPGIDADDLPLVFEPFFRSPRSRRQGRPGIGLGLAIAQRIAVSLGGELTVRSIAGKGSTFRFRLPAASELAPPHVATAEPAAIVATV